MDGDFRKIPGIDFFSTVKGRIQKGIIYAFDYFDDLLIPFFLLINVRNKQGVLCRALYHVTYGFGIFIPAFLF